MMKIINLKVIARLFSSSLRLSLALGAVGVFASVGFAADNAKSAGAHKDTYYVNDHIASTVATSDASGEIAQIEADAFGTQTGAVAKDTRFTGKPYDADMGAYVFPFRNYRSDEARWMSADPSGFPDGVNGTKYAPSIFRGFDPFGLEANHASDLATVQAAIEGFKTAGWDAAVRRANWSLDNGKNEVAPQAEINGLFNASAFTDIINNNYFQSAFIANGRQASNYSAAYPVINYGVSNGGVPTSDLGAAYGHLGGSATGRFSTILSSDGWLEWSIPVTFSFSDRYDFGGSDPFSSAFRRLQDNGLASIYNTSGTFTRTYSGRLE